VPVFAAALNLNWTLSQVRAEPYAEVVALMAYKAGIDAGHAERLRK